MRLRGKRKTVPCRIAALRGSATQTRTFVYNTGTTVGTYLLSATNPENGTVKYAYNSDGTLQRKYDAKHQEAQYTYDSYKRVTKIQRGTTTGTWPNETFTAVAAQETDFAYDSVSGCTNGWGRLCTVTYSGTNANSGSGLQNDAYTDSYTYTTPGQVATKQWSVLRTWQVGMAPYPTSTLNFSASYTWDNEGR